MKLLYKVASAAVLSIAIFNVQAKEAYSPSSASAAMDDAPLVEIRNAKRVFPGILSGGQPTNEQLEKAKNKGFKTIINLRPVNEHRGGDEEKTVHKLGMNYINIPVAGASGITNENSQTLIKALSDKSIYPVMIHCASGNRVGALFALDAAQRAQLSTEEAINVGKQSGMTRLEGIVRNIIEK
ncbi:MAG: protein tyrosine phosphatase family protein [Pseudomonadales bacterium]|nr:protein tyrosine phosphatase family protein [Pseudomonadales bacterium]